MNDRGLVRGLLGPFAIEVVQQDGFDGLQRARAYLERAAAGCFYALATVPLGQTSDTDAGSEALLGVRPLAHDDVDQRRGAGTDRGGLPLDALERPIGEAPVAGGHVLGKRTVLAAVRGNARVCGHTVVAMEHFDGRFRVAGPQFLAHERIRHRVEVGLDLDVVVDPGAALLPLGEDVGFGGKRLESSTLYLLKQCASAGAEMARHPIVDLRNEPADGFVELGEREECAITEFGDDPPGGDLYPNLDFRLVPGFVWPCREDRRAVVSCHILVRTIDLRLVEARLDNPCLEIVAHRERRDSAKEGKGRLCEPIQSASDWLPVASAYV